MKIWIFVIIGFMLIWINGCAPSKRIVIERTLSMNEVLEKVNERNNRIKTILADGTITIESPELSNSSSFSLNLKKPDSLKVDFSGPFGIRLGTLTLSRDKFLFYNWMENQAIVGKPNGETFHSIFKFKMNYKEVVDAFTGEFNIDTGFGSQHNFFVDNGLYVLQFSTSEGFREFRINGDNFIIENYRVLDEEKNILLNADLSRLESVDSYSMPTHIRIFFPKENRSISIAYSDFEINENVDCSFSLPKQAQVIFR